MLKHRITYGQGQHVIAESTESARSWFDTWPDVKFECLEYEAYAWPGGYEISYLVKDGGILCHQCANKELMRTLDPDDDQFHIVGEFINWEDSDFYCDHCNRRIEPAYGEN